MGFLNKLFRGVFGILSRRGAKPGTTGQATSVSGIGMAGPAAGGFQMSPLVITAPPIETASIDVFAGRESPIRAVRARFPEERPSNRPLEGRFRDLLMQLETAHKERRYERLMKLLDEAYVQAAAADRDALRAIFREDEGLDHRLSEQLDAAFEQAEAAGDWAASVRAFLVSVSLCYHYDSRDVLLGLASTWRWAETKGIDPLPIYREIGRISSAETTHLVGGSANGMILGLAQDAAYRESLLKR